MARQIKLVEPTDHARLSASSAERWLNCPGSVNLAATHAAPPTAFAPAQGTYAHAIAAECLRTGAKPDEYLGSKGLVEGHEIECDAEMVEGIQLYLDTIAGLRLEKEWVELSLHDALRTLDPDFGGTADWATYSPKLKKLRTVDFKFGAGVFVSVDDNKQLKKYSLGTLLAVGEPVEIVENYIVQPRFEGAPPVRMESFAAFDLMEFAADLIEAAVETRKANARLTPGPWCKKTFCPNAHLCPALETMQHALLKMEFSDIVPVDPVALGKALSDIVLLEERSKAIKALAYATAVAGTKIPNWKLVDKMPRRQWTNPDAAIKWAQERAINPFVEPEIKSPAQMEKGLKKAEKAELKPFYASVSSGSTLVPDSDSRQEISRAVTAADFDVIGGPEAPKQLSADNLFE